MKCKYENDLFVRAALGERTERTPIWMMRQAGRTDPAYSKLRDEVGLPLEALFRHPELAAKISLLPKRLGVDAIIFYQDILTPLSPMGAHFVFTPGPRLEKLLSSVEEVDSLEPYEVCESVPFVGETLARVRAKLDGELPVLGFAGAPLTLAVFILQGESFGSHAQLAFDFIAQYPDAVHRLLDKLSNVTIEYLRYQAKCGVAAVQLFESAAFLFTAEAYKEFALPYQQRVFGALEGVVPTIHFARGCSNLALLDAARSDIISLPTSISIAEARAQLGEDRVFQGNFDNRLLLEGSMEEIALSARACVESGGSRGHIFNLNHGLLRETPYENVQHLVKTVRGISLDKEW